MDSKTIKLFANSLFEVEMLQLDTGAYVVRGEIFGRGPGGEPVEFYSEDIHDFNTASFLFTTKLEELEGN